MCLSNLRESVSNHGRKELGCSRSLQEELSKRCQVCDPNSVEDQVYFPAHRVVVVLALEADGRVFALALRREEVRLFPTSVETKRCGGNIKIPVVTKVVLNINIATLEQLPAPRAAVSW